MNTATGDIVIPPQVEGLYTRLCKRYELEFEPLTVRDRRFRFLHLKDIEPLVAGKDIFAESSDFPFWVKMWEASVVMADFLSRIEPAPDQRMLEIGAGLGTSGIVAASFGHRVVISDYEDEILDFVRISAAVNQVEGILLQKLDWLNPKDIGRFDVIVGSEVLFHRRFFDPLLRVFRACLAPGGVIYLAHDARRRSLAKFLPLCEPEYDIAVQKRHLHSESESFEIILSRLVQKQTRLL